jgi:hypothetical protein
MSIDKAKALIEEYRKTKEFNEMIAELAVEEEDEDEERYASPRPRMLGENSSGN